MPCITFHFSTPARNGWYTLRLRSGSVEPRAWFDSAHHRGAVEKIERSRDLPPTLNPERSRGIAEKIERSRGVAEKIERSRDLPPTLNSLLELSNCFKCLALISI